MNEQNYLELVDMIDTATRNVENVYNAGYTVGRRDGYSADAYNDGYTAGKQDSEDKFWDAYQEMGKRTSYQYAFAGIGWNDETFKPKHDIVLGLGFTGTNMFWGCQCSNIAGILEREGVVLDTEKCGYMSYMFQNTSTIRIPTINCTHAADYNASNCLMNMFSNSSVEIIDKMIVTEDCVFTNTFQGCSKLEYITFEGSIGHSIDFQSSVKLSPPSISNIIEHLSDNASGQTLTLSRDAVEDAFLDADWNALAATKPNWTITLI